MARRRNRDFEIDDEHDDREDVELVKLFSAYDWKHAKRSANVAGDKKAFESPRKLWDLACQYFQSVESNPIKKHDVLRSGPMVGRAILTYHPRPFTWMGFETFLFVKGIISTLEPYKQNREGRYEDFQDVIRAIGNVMQSQKYDGAAVGLFKEQLIMRELYPAMTRGEGAIDPGSNPGNNFSAPVVNVYYNGAPPLSNSENDVDTQRPEPKE